MRVNHRGSLGVRANVEIIGWDAHGRRIWTQRGHNLVVLAGRNLVRDLLKNEAPAGLTHFALGSGSTAVADGNTALVTEVLRDSITQYTAGSSTLLLKYYLSTTMLNGTTIREAGLFNAASGPTMFARYVLATPIVKDNTIAVTFLWLVTIASS